MLNSRMQFTFLTSVCNVEYKKCIKLDNLDICTALFHDCRGTGKFIHPERKYQPKRPKKKEVVFSKDENDVNLRRCKKKKFYDAKKCRHLCSETLVLKSRKSVAISPCEMICFQLTRSFDSAGEVCPFEKYCPTGTLKINIRQAKQFKRLPLSLLRVRNAP